MTTDKGKTDIFFVQLIKTENLRIKFTDKKKTYARHTQIDTRHFS